MALSKKLAVLGFGSFVGATVLTALGSATANAEVQESAPAPYVTSRQAQVIDENALRFVDYGQARGFMDTRSADPGVVHAQGEGVHVDTIKAVPGTTASAFNVGANAQFNFGAPMGSFGGNN